MIKIVKIYTDGSAGPTNPGPGGFGVVVVENDEVIDVFQYTEIGDTTNNRMEMKAILWAMENYGKIEKQFLDIPMVYSDSSYAVNTFNDWIFSWERRGWKKANNQEPENMDLLKQYFEMYNKGIRIHLQKVKGHAGNKYNEMADKMAGGKVKFIAEVDGGYSVEFKNFETIQIKPKPGGKRNEN